MLDFEAESAFWSSFSLDFNAQLVWSSFSLDFEAESAVGRRSEAELTVLSSFLLGFEAKLSFRWIWPNRRFGRPFCSEAEAAAFLLEAFFSLFEGRIVCFTGLVVRSPNRICLFCWI